MRVTARLVVPLVIVVLAASSCGGGDESSTSSASDGSSTTKASTASGGDGWYEDDDEADGAIPEEEPGDPSDPASEEAEELAGGPEGETDGESPDDDRDPCSLVTQAEFEAFAGQSLGQERLEDGDACGYRNVDDTVRLAVAALERSPGSDGYLSADDAKGCDEISGLPGPARWCVGWPLDATSTLVVTMPGFDIVIELSSRGDASDDELLDAARDFATTAAGRL